MGIKGLQKTSLLDYPGKIVSTLFFGGCNFRCPYCQNPELVLDHSGLPDISEEQVMGHLAARRKLLDGVCVTGGEPTLYDRLPELLSKMKREGFLVKVDTNGTNPDMLKELIDSRITDYVAMDIKSPLERYQAVVRAKVRPDDIEESVEILKTSDIEYEFRTTVVPGLLDKSDIQNIGRWLDGSRRWVLQQFEPHKTLDPSYQSISPYSTEEMEELASLARPYFGSCEVRGI